MHTPVVRPNPGNRSRIRTLVRRGELIRLHRGIYVPAVMADVPAVRAIAALAAVPSAVVSHDTAAALWNIDLVRASDIDHVTVPFAARRPSWATLSVHATDLRPEEITSWQGHPVTTLGRTVRDLLVHSDRLTAVWAVEQVLAQTFLTRDDLLECVSSQRARQWCSMADDRSESALETGVRLVIRDAGLPAPEAQIPIRDDRSATRFRIDLGYRESRLGIECDGRQTHDRPEAIYADRSRANILNQAGWRLLRFTWRDLTQRPDYIAATVRAALACARG